ncbi:type I restriction-modification system subunit M [Nocardioides sp. URHA0032]|uniref:type I restriction-modification system subunit M n=1 Tax=Nocardioides sp. URHA0032 TaxID=1380388 RepID=UPI0018CC5096|nr:class I SAM-dependent DNA methyltransferase [Nocardioides sp. URHA0032]
MPVNVQQRAKTDDVDADNIRSRSKADIPVKLTQQELESRLWGAANALRGPVDPADFKTYVFPMLFWKWISDTWLHEHHEAVSKWGDNLDDEIEADFHRFAVPDQCLWSDVTTKTGENLGVRVRRALDKVEQANPATLANVFGDAQWGNKERLPESALIALVNAFNGVPLDPESVSHDALGHAYEYLLKQFAEASGKKAGEFFTPPSVVHLLVNILDPKPDEEVYDPACGSGGMLVETINAIEAHGGDSREVRLFGQEVNLTTSAIARMNLAFHQKVGSEIRRGDTLREPKFWNTDGTFRQFDVVLANPPFSLENWGADTWPADPRSFCGVPPAKNGDYAWIQHMIASMKPGHGRVGVVMPHGVLFRGGSEAKIRQCLIEEDRLEAVIGLPNNLFYSTTIPACLLIFRAEKSEERRNHVLFVDATARFTKDKNQNTMTEGDVQVTLDAYRTGGNPNDEGIEARLVPFDEIKANGFDLNITRYVAKAREESFDVGSALVAYGDSREVRRETERAMFARLAAAGVDVSTLGVGE